MSVQIMNSLETGEEQKRKRPSDPLVRRLRNVGKKPTGKSHRVRIKLPPIDAYEKELEYPCEGPGRVVVRLERLVGTDKVKVTDRRYMTNLLKKLEEEEMEVWNKRNKVRRKGEKERSRQLVINGKMEPGQEMGDLLKHPVFRVNRILARLDKMDASMINTGPIEKLPPIVPVEPFEEFNRTGILFGFHKDHYLKAKGSGDDYSANSGELTKVPSFNYNPPVFDMNGKPITQVGRASDEFEVLERPRLVPITSFAAFDDNSEWLGEDAGDDFYFKPQFKLYTPEKTLKLPIDNDASRRSVSELIQLMRKRTTITDNSIYKEKYQKDLEKSWQVRRSHLIDLLYKSDQLDPDGLYGFSKQILDTYRREQLVVDNFISKEYRKLF